MADAYECIIVGAGAAGLSAALILGRACRKTLVLDDGRPRNAVADRMHGFITRDGTPPLELLATAREELKRYENVTVAQEHVETISGAAGLFDVETLDRHVFQAGRVLLAMGVYDALPSIDGLREVWGRTAFVCPYCDAWEVRGKRIAVVAKGAKAVELAQELHQWSSDIVICSQGANSLPAEYQRWVERTGSTHLAQPVRRIVSNDSQVTAVEFSDGTQEHCDAVFLNASLRPRYPLVEQLGCRLREDGEIDIDEHGRTSVAGIYAAGDAVTTVHQVVLAAASGVCAAIAMNEDCLQDDVRRAIR